MVGLALNSLPQVFSAPDPFMALGLMSACSLSLDMNSKELVRKAKALDGNDQRAISEDLNE
jgi:hypothetical protein